MTYSVKEIYYTVQGEGGQAGIPAIFLRFTGCNLWSGREADRAKAVCKFCDTDFIGTSGPGGGQFKDAQSLIQRLSSLWPRDARGQLAGEPWVVCTGGEPLLQLDEALIAGLHKAGFKIAVETNGTVTAPRDIDWICVSPKADTQIVQTYGDELKLVFPQSENKPEDYTHLNFKRFSLQPLFDANYEQNAKSAFDYCLANPIWQLSLQTHKWLGVP